jgi:hypothetical protein
VNCSRSDSGPRLQTERRGSARCAPAHCMWQRLLEKPVRLGAPPYRKRSKFFFFSFFSTFLRLCAIKSLLELNRAIHSFLCEVNELKWLKQSDYSDIPEAPVNYFSWDSGPRIRTERRGSTRCAPVHHCCSRSQIWINPLKGPFDPGPRHGQYSHTLFFFFFLVSKAQASKQCFPVYGPRNRVDIQYLRWIRRDNSADCTHGTYHISKRSRYLAE